jgi:hypothetical protein
VIRNAIIVALAVVLVSAFAVTGALAALPKKGGTYEGTLFASGTGPLTKKVRVVVASSGTSARVIWWCGTGRAPSTLKFKINPDGSFRAFSNTGSLTVWSFVGRFTSPTNARAALRPTVTCDGKGGTVNLLLTS